MRNQGFKIDNIIVASSRAFFSFPSPFLSQVSGSEEHSDCQYSHCLASSEGAGGFTTVASTPAVQQGIHHVDYPSTSVYSQAFTYKIIFHQNQHQGVISYQRNCKFSHI